MSPLSCHKRHHTEERHGDKKERWKRTRGRRRHVARGKDKRERSWVGVGGVRNKETKERKEKQMKGHTLKRTNRRREESVLQDRNYTNSSKTFSPVLVLS